VTILQRLGGGGVRVVPGNQRTQLARVRASRAGRTGSLAAGPGQAFDLSVGGFLKGAARIGSKLLPGDPIGTIETLAGLVGGGRGSCPEGFERNAKGECAGTGFVDRMQQFIPGGETGTIADVRGDAVVGAFGLPAIVPRQVGQVTRNDGVVSPILRCPRRMVLGTDNLCYPKAILGKRSKFRKHRRPVSPPVTSADRKAITKAASARERVKELAMDVGFTCTTGPKGRKKKKN